MKELTAPAQVDLDAKILELRDTLRAVLQRYQDLSFMDTPSWDFTEEVPVQDARRMLRRDEYSEEIYQEFYALRKLARAVRYYRKYLTVLREIEEDVTSIEATDLDITEEELEEKVASWREKMYERLDKYISLKA